MLKFFYIIQLLALLAFYALGEIVYSNFLLTFVVCQSVVNAFFFFFHTKQQPNVQLPIFIFCIGYLIVFFQFYIEIVLGNIDVSEIPYSFADPDVILKCAIMSAMGLLAFFLGVLSLPLPPPVKCITIEKDLPDIQSAFRGRSILMLSAFAFFLATNYQFLFGVQYSQALIESRSFLSNMSVVFFQSVFFLQLAHTCCMIKKAKQTVSLKGFARALGRIFNLVTLGYILALLQFGDRGEVLTVVLSYCGAFLIVSKFTLKYRYILICGIIGGLLFSFVASFREMDRELPVWDRIEQCFQNDNHQSKQLFRLTTELARSVATFNNAASYIPSAHGVMNGYFHFLEIINIIPGSARLFRGDDHFAYWGSAYFCTWIYFGDDYPWGTGTAWNTDLYINYGLAGVILGSFVWGMLLAYLRNRLSDTTPSIYVFLCYIILMGASLYIVRASCLYFIRVIAYACGLCFVLGKMRFINMGNAAQADKAPQLSDCQVKK